ncbi:hypothetical protein ACLB1Q_18060 [Escherichia coli]
MSGINSDDNFIASVASRRARCRTRYRITADNTRSAVSVLNGLRAGSLTRGATTVGVSTRFATTGGGGGGGGASALIVKTTV